MDKKPFQIYRSSAGSGKTYQLAKEYITLGLSDPDSFYRILGVTFTNKATDEMKQRIVSFLRELSLGEMPALAKEISAGLELDEKEINKRAGDLLSNILHNYGRFAVVTIDSFFHQVIRSFAREMGLQGSFSIELDAATVIENIVDELLSRLGNTEYGRTRKWLIEYAESRVDHGSSWDSSNDVKTLALELLKDDFKPRASEIIELSEKKNYFTDILKELNQIKYGFENHIKSIGHKGIQLILAAGGLDNFKAKSRGPASMFFKAKELNLNFSQTIINSTEGIEKWLTAENQKNNDLVQRVENEILPTAGQLLDYYHQNSIEYNSANAVLEYFYTFGILAELTKILRDYREENDIMLIADLPDFLRQIIKDSDTPYIYEKVGSRFHHYLMDEFQDTSAYQWENFKPLVKNATDEGSRSIAVGDIKQSIYRWRGGDFNLLQEKIEHDIGSYNTDTRLLDKNWRSSKDIVEFNNMVFSGTEFISDLYFADIDEQFLSLIESTQKLYADAAQKVVKENHRGIVSINFLEKDDSEDPVKEQAIQLCIEKVAQLQREGFSLRDMAILVRRKSEGVRIAKAFFNAKEQYDEDLNFNVVSSEALYLSASSTVGFIVSLLKWMNNPDDEITLADWVHKYEKYILDSVKTDHEILSNRADWKSIVPKEFVKEKEYLVTLPLYEIVAQIIRIFKLEVNAGDFVYLQGFQDAILEYSKNQRGDISSFIDWWETTGSTRSIQLSEENEAIRILTIHKAKGLEFPIVFIPFLDWGFDSEGGLNKNILWCNPVDRSPFNKMPVIPLRYTSKLSETFWAQNYWEEKIKNYLDSLNLLYVAFTRPQAALYTFSEMPSKPGERKVKTVGDALFHFLSSQDSGWDAENNRFKTGEMLAATTREEVAQREYALQNYPCYPWREKVGLQLKGSLELSKEVFVSKLSGIKVHNILSTVKELQDLLAVDDDEIREYLMDILHHEDIKPFFENIQEVKNEVPILLPGGKVRRIDRLVKKDNDWIVIDFKTGSPNEKHISQVKNYMQLLQKMNYENVTGKLVYLDGKEVVTI